MKRVFALLCALALVLPMICTGAAAAAPNEYVFEKVPDIMYLDGTFEFPYVGIDGGPIFFCESILQSGLYNIKLISVYDEQVYLETFEPLQISLDPLVMDDAVIPGVYMSSLAVVFSIPSGGQVTLDCSLLVADDADGENGSMFDFPPYADVAEDACIVLTRVDDSAPSGDEFDAVSTIGAMSELMDLTIKEIMKVPIMGFFFAASILMAAVGLFLSLKAAAGGRRRR